MATQKTLFESKDVADTPSLRLYLDDAQAIDDLFRQSLNSCGAEAFQDFIDFVIRHRRLSVFNAMLIHVQRPGASAVFNRANWLERVRTINPDAIPIIILRPFGPVEFLYELSDTSGEPVKGADADPFAAVGAVPEDAWDRAAQAARKNGITIEAVNYGTGQAGTAAALGSHSESETLSAVDQPMWRIRINRAHDFSTRFATLAHELGHIYCGHQGPGPKDRWPSRYQILTTAECELEAEATSFLVCRRIDVATNN